MLLGLALYGVAIAFEVRARLGLDPWDVFHQGSPAEQESPSGRA
jgi:hypothetical protein